MIEHVIRGMALGRTLIGLAPFVAAGASSRLLAFPPHHDNATARLMARLFGVRNVGLGVLAIYALSRPAVLAFVLLFNALVDLADLFAIAAPLVRRQGIDRAAWRSAGFALSAGLGWLIVFLIVR